MQINVYSKQEWIQRINDWQADAADKLNVRNNRSDGVLRDVARDRERVWIRPVLFDFRSYSFDFSSRTTTHIRLPQGQEVDSSENNNNNLIALAAACVMGASVAVFAYMLAKYNRSNVAITNTNFIADSLPVQRVFDSNDVFSKIHELVCLRLSIEQREHARITNYVLSSGITFIGGAALFAGAYTLTPALITAGTVTILAGALFATFNFFYHLEDSVLDAANYREITGYRIGNKGQQGIAETIKKMLPKYKDNMELIEYVNVPQEGYQPMFGLGELPTCGNTAPSAPAWEPQVEGH